MAHGAPAGSGVTHTWDCTLSCVSLLDDGPFPRVHVGDHNTFVDYKMLQSPLSLQPHPSTLILGFGSWDISKQDTSRGVKKYRFSGAYPSFPLGTWACHPMNKPTYDTIEVRGTKLDRHQELGM